MELLKEGNDDGPQDPLVDIEAVAAQLLDGELPGDNEVDPIGLNEVPNDEKDAVVGDADGGLEGDEDPIPAVSEPAEAAKAVDVDSGAGDTEPVAVVTGIAEDGVDVGDVARADGTEAVQAGAGGAKAAIDGAKGDAKPASIEAGGAAAEAVQARRQDRQGRRARQAPVQADDEEIEVIRDDFEEQGVVPELSLQASIEKAVRKATREMRSEIRALRNEVSHLKMRNFVADEFARPGSGKITSAEFNVELYKKCLQDHFVRNPALLLAGMNQVMPLAPGVGLPLAQGVGIPLAQGAGTSNGASAPPTQDAATDGIEGAEDDAEDEEDINDEDMDALMDEEDPEDVIDVDDEEPAPKKAKTDE
ncbi:hypothetical protein B9Z55_025305 [Caenorhabditis nigoni]|nr:hypothetical protein B9Z55_025305 [Caenorhabditis nigoni]